MTSTRTSFLSLRGRRIFSGSRVLFWTYYLRNLPRSGVKQVADRYTMLRGRPSVQARSAATDQGRYHLRTPKQPKRGNSTVHIVMSDNVRFRILSCSRKIVADKHSLFLSFNRLHNHGKCPLLLPVGGSPSLGRALCFRKADIRFAFATLPI